MTNNYIIYSNMIIPKSRAGRQTSRRKYGLLFSLPFLFLGAAYPPVTSYSFIPPWVPKICHFLRPDAAGGFALHGAKDGVGREIAGKYLADVDVGLVERVLFPEAVLPLGLKAGALRAAEEIFVFLLSWETKLL